MKTPASDIEPSIRAVFADRRWARRAFLGKVGGVSVGTALATLGSARTAGAFPSVPPPASFTTLLGLCTSGTALATFTPGITNTLQAIRTDTTVMFSPAAPVAQNKAVSAVTLTIDQIVSCSGVTDLSGVSVIHYTSGQTSNWTIDSWTISRLLGQAALAVSGLITNGPFNSARVWQFGVRAVPDGSLCASATGVTSSSGTDIFIIAQ